MRIGAMALLGVVVFTVSCTSIRYRSTGVIATSFSPKPMHVHQTNVEGRKEFYLWGLVPNEHTVEIDKEMSRAGLISAANITIEEYQTLGDKFATWLSLGLYIPRSYKVRGFGIKTDDRL
ncbi:MAG: hypothetical protein CME70_23975 [Halobacteriovorax sp.]|nr:hypothetical protein [Halobacteriovorax sp.]